MPANQALIVCSQKGGVGKTTTSLGLAVSLHRLGHPVVLVDADPLNCIENCVNLTPDREHAEIGRWKRYSMQNLPGLQVLVNSSRSPLETYELKLLLNNLDGGIAIIDSPPMIDPQITHMLKAATAVLVVASVEPWSLRTMPLVLEALLENRTAGHSFEFLGVLATCLHGDDTEKEWVPKLRTQFGGAFLPTVLPFEPTQAKAIMDGVPLALSKPDCPLVKAFDQVAAQISQRLLASA